jgi:hypothetical protein
LAHDAAEDRHGCVMFTNNAHFILTATWHIPYLHVFVFTSNQEKEER